MPNWFPNGTGEEGDESGQQYQYILRQQKEERERYLGKRLTTQESDELPTWNSDKRIYD